MTVVPFRPVQKAKVEQLICPGCRGTTWEIYSNCWVYCANEACGEPVTLAEITETCDKP